MRAANDIKAFFATLKNKAGITALVASLLVIGVFLALFSSPSDTKASDSFRKAEEKRLEELVLRLDGVDSVSVMISVEKKVTNEKSAFGFSGGSDDGGDYTVKGVALVMSGNSSESLKLEISRLVCGLYGIGANKVSVIF